MAKYISDLWNDMCKTILNLKAQNYPWYGKQLGPDQHTWFGLSKWRESFFY